MNPQDFDRFMAKVEQPEHHGCWIWVAATVGNGYGVFWKDGRLQYAHRVAYEHWVGPIPGGMELDHLCRVRNCVHPPHLEPVTHAENGRRGREARPKRTHCARGHAYTDHGFTDSRGDRQCRICARRRNAEYKQRLKVGT